MLFERPAPYLVLLCGAVHFLCERQTSQVHTYWWAGWRKCHIPWVTYDGRESSGMRPLSANTWFVWDKSFFVSMLYWLPRRAGARFKRKIFTWVLGLKIAWILAWDSIQEACKRKENFFQIWNSSLKSSPMNYAHGARFRRRRKIVTRFVTKVKFEKEICINYWFHDFSSKCI